MTDLADDGTNLDFIRHHLAQRPTWARMTDVAVARLRAAMVQITADPATYNQLTFGRREPCGTTHCIAGWVMSLHDASRFRWVTLACEPGDQVVGYARADGTVQSTGLAAADLLGLSDYDAALLFGASTTLDEVWLLVETYTDGRVLRADVEREVMAARPVPAATIEDEVTV